MDPLRNLASQRRGHDLFNKAKSTIGIALAVGLVALMGILPASAQNGPSATRSFSAASVDAGAEVTVTIDVANYGGFGRVTETLPGGFTYKSSSLADFQVDDSDDQVVKFTLQGKTSFTYVVTASTTDGPHDFSGELRDSYRNNHTVGGATSVTVREATAPSTTPTPTATPITIQPQPGQPERQAVFQSPATVNVRRGRDGHYRRGQLRRLRARHRDAARRLHLRVLRPRRQPGGRQRRPDGQVHPPG